MKPEEFYNNNNMVTENRNETCGLSSTGNNILKVLCKYSPSMFLDIGCGQMTLSKKILENCNSIKEYHGVDISDYGVSALKKLGILAKKVNVDESPLPYQDNYFDFVLAGAVIEHIFDPDHLLSEAHRVLKKDAYFMLSTPNLASWHNRIALLLGYQPHHSEVSTKYSVGKLFTTNKLDVSGHLRLFTLRALRELLVLYNFKVIKVFGCSTKYLIDKLPSKIPAIATDLLILTKKI